jgi:MarR family transcriptional regulator, lower aerobic nicotinate degradation pathway regulator
VETSPARVRTKPSWLLNQAALPANRLLAEALSTADARRHHYVLLAVLDEAGPISQAELGRRSNIDRSDIVGDINELSERHLVERVPDHTDRRRNLVTLTASGRRHLRKLDKLLAEVQDDLLVPLTPDERELLVDLLSRVVAHHRSQGASDPTRVESSTTRKR